MKRILSAILIISLLLSSIPMTSFATTATQIPDDAVNYNGHAYKVYKEALEWEAAKTRCESLGGHLVTITSKEENEFVVSMISGGKYHIGGSDVLTEGTWQWVTGETWAWTNWDSRGDQEPNNLSEQDYLMIHADDSDDNALGSWDDGYSIDSYVAGFVCEWECEIEKNEGLTTGDIFCLGYYPQEQVIDDNQIAALNSCVGEWISYDYYTSGGVKSDYMKYQDVIYNGTKYRAITFSAYRPYANQKTNGFEVDNVYWFKYQPLQWKLLDAETGLSICQQVIDSQEYHHTSESTNGYYGNNYEKSDIRNWLINNFFNTAFSEPQQSYIVEKMIDNTAVNTKYSATSTNDKVFALSKWEADSMSSSERKVAASDYAKAQGVWINEDGCAQNWSLRTAANKAYSTYYVEKRSGDYIAYYNWYDDAIHVQSRGVRPAFYLNLENYREDIKREAGFNFYLNHPSNYINVNSTVDLHIGYYLDNVLDASVSNYVYTISDSEVIDVADSGWSSKYGQKLKITAKQEGSSTITVTNPNTSESSSLEIYVTGNESGWNFYNIPKMTIEEGKTTNFYNYSGMVVDEFAYTEHKNSSGAIDYYNVTMTVYNSINLYGVVTSHYADGSVYGYYILDKMNSHDSSFVSSLNSLYYSSGDLYYLIKNDKYYSGKSISTENNVTIDVPVGGYISISNNVAVSDMANLVNFTNLLFDMVNVVGSLADWDVSGEYVIDDVKKVATNKLITGILADDAIKDEILSCLKKSVSEEFKGLSLNYDNLIDAFVSVNNKLIKNVGFNIIEELESEICSAMGIASIGESVATKVLPTGWIIEGLYSFSDGCDFAVFFNAYCKSKGRPGGINIYAPSDSSKYQSNGISIDTQDDMSETVVHAYTVADTGTTGINKNTFTDESIYYSEKYQTYNITLYKNGTETQPSSTVTVRIPIPDRFDKMNRSALKVYRNNDDGTLTNMNAHVEGDYMVFETAHFSYYSIVDESVPLAAEDLKFSGASLTLQDDLTVNYKVDKNRFDVNGYTNPYVEFVMNEKTTVVTKYEVLDDKYVFDFSDIAPNFANDTIQATLYAEKEGVTYFSETRDYSIAEYCYNMLDKYNADEYAKLRTLLVDLLNYGAASQNYTTYKTDSLVNESLAEEQLLWGTQETPTLNTVLSKEYAVIDNPSVIWKGAGLNLQDSVNMRFKIETDDIEDISVKVTTDTGLQWIIYSDAFETTEGGYYVFFDGLNVGQMREAVYLTVYDNNEIVSNTIRYSIESYAFSKQDSGDESLSVLLLAMMKYGNSVYAYAN